MSRCRAVLAWALMCLVVLAVGWARPDTARAAQATFVASKGEVTACDGCPCPPGTSATHVNCPNGHAHQCCVLAAGVPRLSRNGLCGLNGDEPGAMSSRWITPPLRPPIARAT
jgi:hypothetical protein